jgi:hypothetical protein
MDVESAHGAGILKHVLRHFGPAGHGSSSSAAALGRSLGSFGSGSGGSTGSVLGGSLGASFGAAGAGGVWGPGGSLSLPRIDPSAQAFAIDRTDAAFRAVAARQPGHCYGAAMAVDSGVCERGGGQSGGDGCGSGLRLWAHATECVVVCPSGVDMLA